MFELNFMDKLLGRSGRRKAARARTTRFSPALESLEGRALMANIGTSLVGGNLSLTDNGATSVVISQPAPNQIRLTPTAGTTINGQALAVTISGVTGNLSANLGTGNDSLTFDLSGGDISVRNLSITGTTGDKTVNTVTGESDNFLNVHGNYTQVFGNGNEFTGLNQFDVDGNMTIDHANGGSFVFLGVDKANLGTEFNRVGGNLIVDNVNPSGKAANGFDVNALEETNVGGNIRANMGYAQIGGPASGVAGWTSVGSQSDRSIDVGGDVTLTNLTGFLSFGDFANDGLEVQNANVAGHVTMDLGSGVGNTALFGGSAGSLSITGRGAHDGVTIGAADVAGDLEVSLSGRNGNSLAVDSLFAGGDVSFELAGSGNEIAIDDEAPGSTFEGAVDIVMAGRNNFLSINSKHLHPQTGTTTFNGEVTAKLGGRSTLMLAAIGEVDFEAPATFDGGPGHNTAVVGTGNLTGVEPEVVRFDVA
jgi:DNA/RNA endonuclease YhcR with UshA esterase domain